MRDSGVSQTQNAPKRKTLACERKGFVAQGLLPITLILRIGRGTSIVVGPYTKEFIMFNKLNNYWQTLSEKRNTRSSRKAIWWILKLALLMLRLVSKAIDWLGGADD